MNASHPPARSARPSRLRRVAVGLGALLPVVGGLGCSSDEEPVVAAPTREEVARDLVDDLVVPAAEQAATTAGDFRDAVVALCDAPDDARLSAARDALAAGWSAWRYTDSFDIGPAMQRRSGSVVSYAVDPAKVDAILLSGPPTDPETVRNRTGSSLRGYGAAFHLLNSGLAEFTGGTARCAYVQAVATVIADETALVAEGWTAGLEGAAPYRDTAVGEGPDSLTPTDVIDAFVNMQLSQLEATGKVLTAAAEADPASPSDLPVGELFQVAAQADGMAATYDEGLDELLDDRVADRAGRSLAAVVELLAADAVAPSAEVPDSARLSEVAAAIEEARVTVSTEIVSALDVTVSFSENDGDS